jgi:hypothetical protein
LENTLIGAIVDSPLLKGRESTLSGVSRPATKNSKVRNLRASMDLPYSRRNGAGPGKGILKSSLGNTGAIYGKSNQIMNPPPQVKHSSTITRK